MTVLSVLRSSSSIITSQLTKFQVHPRPFTAFLTTSAGKCGGHGPRMLNVLPSRYQWNKYKDSLHFYIMLGAIPSLAFVFFINVTIGPATLTETPVGYRPKQEEFHRHPITRWLAKNWIGDPQEVYERNMFYVNEADERKRMKQMEKKVLKLMQQRGDYPNYFYSKLSIGKYLRARVLEVEEIEKEWGQE